jgi:hypothetical protein
MASKNDQFYGHCCGRDPFGEHCFRSNSSHVNEDIDSGEANIFLSEC